MGAAEELYSWRGWGEYRDVPLSPWVVLSRDRQVRDLERAAENDPSFPYYYDSDAADRAVKFISELRHYKGVHKGKPFILTDWQEWDIVRPLFGWRRKSDGSRRFRKAFVEVARKNGKTALAAAIMLYLMLADGEFGAEIFSVATKEAQAKRCWDAAAKFCKHSPKLRALVRQYSKRINCDFNDSFFLPLGADSHTEDGWDPHGTCVDEYHAHPTDGMIEVMKTGMGARRQPLLFIITTAGDNPDGPCKQEEDYCKKVLTPQLDIVNEQYLIYIAQPDNEDDFLDESTWWKANPNLGITVLWDYIREQCREADQKPSKRADFLTKNLNMWVKGAQKFIDMPKWHRCKGKLDLDWLAGRRCFGGLDMGVSGDLSALALAFGGDEILEKGKRLIYLLMRYWAPEQGAWLAGRTDKVDYLRWAEAGWIKLTPGERTSRQVVFDDILELAGNYEIAELAVDTNYAVQLADDLAQENLLVLPHRQTAPAMNLGVRELEDAYIEQRLIHGEDPVLTWMAGNVVPYEDANENLKFLKNRSTGRIDGMVAATMAIGRLLTAKEPVASPYKKRGIVFL